MGATPTYQVIFSGKLREGFTQAQVKQTFAEKLKLPDKQLAALFSGKPLVLKRTQSAEEAKRLLAALAGFGAIARIQSDQKRGTTARSAAPQEAVEPVVELPRFSPHPRGGRLIASLTIAAAAELFFALLYVALILSFSVGLVYSNLFTTWGASVTGFGPLALLIQLITLALGMVVLFLLAKPLWAFNPKHHQGTVVTAEQEPRLYEFVADVCERISAPMPQQIRITNSTDVELSYLGGPLGFVRNRHLLTIGAPLVAVCDASQLAALIAQSLQLSHSKSLSPRAAYLLRASDSWLQRAIYGKDRIDRRLASLHDDGEGLSAPIALLQRLIALSRQLLGWRLLFSRYLNRSLMHRLVADADKVSLVFTGSAGFRQLVEQQRLLAFASQNTLPGLMEAWRKGGDLPNNLIQTLALRCRQYPPETHQKLRLAQEQEKAASHDIIPADSQRLRRVSKIKVAPAYADHRRASELFRNFTKLSQTMTVRLYHNRLAIPVSPDRLQPAAAPSRARQQQQQQIDALFHGLYLELLPLKLSQLTHRVGDFDEARKLHRAALAEGEQALSRAELTHKRCLESEQAVVDIHTQEVMHQTGLWKRWGLQAENREGLEQLQRACREQEQELEDNLAQFDTMLQPYTRRVGALLALLQTPQGQKVDKAQALQKEVKTLLEVMERIEKALPQLRSLKLHNTLLRILLSYDDDGNGKLREHIQQQCGDIQQLLAGLGANFKTTPYPFGGGHKNLMDFASSEAFSDATAEGDYDRGHDVVEKITFINRHILARLCAIALHMEKGVGLRG